MLWSAPGLGKTRFLGKVFRFLGFQVFLVFGVLMYEDRTQNYDQEIHEEYLIHDTPFPLPHRFVAMCRL